MRGLLIIPTVVLLGLAAISSPTYANCVCRCVNGEVQAICSSAIDIQPICSQGICPIATPGITPIQPLGIPPLGTTDCHQAQVYNPYTRQYEWKTLCN